MVETISILGSHLKYVDHTYRDFSHFVDDGGQLTKHKKSGNNFPARLHRMLSEPRNYHAIAWMPHGRAWKILDKERLVAEVIPHYYCAKKYESFSRQLNGWGFKRLHQSGPDCGCYYHECFLRDLPSLMCLIRRLPSNMGKSTPYAEGEPNFYRTSEKYPLPPRDLPPAEPPRARAASLDLDAAYRPHRVEPRARAASMDATAAGNVACGTLRHLMPQEAVLPEEMESRSMTGTSLAGTSLVTSLAATTSSSYHSAIDLGGYPYPTPGGCGYPSYAPGYAAPTSFYPGFNPSWGPAFQDYRGPVALPAPHDGYYSQESLLSSCGRDVYAPRFPELPGVTSPAVGADSGGTSTDLEPLPLSRSKSQEGADGGPEAALG